MTDRLQKLVIDCSTGEQTYIDLTDEEIAQYDARQAQAIAEQQAIEEAQAQREADKASAISKLTTLGLTEDEALALVGA